MTAGPAIEPLDCQCDGEKRHFECDEYQYENADLGYPATIWLCNGKVYFRTPHGIDSDWHGNYHLTDYEHLPCRPLLLQFNYGGGDHPMHSVVLIPTWGGRSYFGWELWGPIAAMSQIRMNYVRSWTGCPHCERWEEKVDPLVGTYFDC